MKKILFTAMCSIALAFNLKAQTSETLQIDPDGSTLSILISEESHINIQFMFPRVQIRWEIVPNKPSQLFVTIGNLTKKIEIETTSSPPGEKLRDCYSNFIDNEDVSISLCNNENEVFIIFSYKNSGTSRILYDKKYKTARFV